MSGHNLLAPFPVGDSPTGAKKPLTIYQVTVMDNGRWGSVNDLIKLHVARRLQGKRRSNWT